MKEQVYEKSDVINRLDRCCQKTLGQIDNKEIFNRVKEFPLQKALLVLLLNSVFLVIAQILNKKQI